MSPDREADLAVGSAVEPSDRVPALRRCSAGPRPSVTPRAGEVAPHLDHRDPSLANPDAIRMRVFQGDRHPPRRVDNPMGRVRWDLDPGRELVAGCGLRLPVTTTRAAGEDKSSERCGRHRQSHPLAYEGRGRSHLGQRAGVSPDGGAGCMPRVPRARWSIAGRCPRLRRSLGAGRGALPPRCRSGLRRPSTVERPVRQWLSDPLGSRRYWHRLVRGASGCARRPWSW